MSDILFQIDEGIKNLATNLCMSYPEHLGHVDISKVIFTRKWGNIPKKSQVGEIFGVKGYAKQKLREFGEDFEYEFNVWAEAWDQIDESIQQLLLFHALYSIKPDSNGKLKQPDVQEFGPICEYFGPYWRREKFVELLFDPNNPPLPLPLPPDDDPDGSTTGDFDPLY